KLECMSDTGRRRDCPANLATGRGTGFKLVTEHLAKFAKRGVCARDPQRAQLDGTMMAMPRQNAAGEFEPYSPANALPYGHRWRLFHTPNDAFLTANTHKEGISLFDIMQPAYAGLYSGALHPTAEGHAVVADSVLPHVRSIIAATHAVPAVAAGRERASGHRQAAPHRRHDRRDPLAPRGEGRRRRVLLPAEAHHRT